jgi:TetR/AcrR family transcriptional repressor of nem operon
MSRLNTTDTKERLLQTAMDLIAAGSYGSVSVDKICAKAKVKKGSFYYFFPSKCDLAIAGLDNFWQNVLRPELDRIFSTQIPSVNRIVDFFEFNYKLQKEKQKQFGFVAGCPFTAVGSEQGTLDEKIRKDMERLLNLMKKYIESAIGDGVREKMIPDCDIKEMTDAVFLLYIGVLTQARIANSIESLSAKKIRPVLFHIMEVDAAKVEG